MPYQFFGAKDICYIHIAKKRWPNSNRIRNKIKKLFLGRPACQEFVHLNLHNTYSYINNYHRYKHIKVSIFESGVCAFKFV